MTGITYKEDLDTVTLETSLINLEPAGTRAVAATELAGALVEPDEDGALTVSPLLPDGGDVISRLRRRELGC